MRIVHAPGVFWDVVDGRTVICDPASGQLYELNASAAFLWETGGDATEESVVERLATTFPGHDPELLAADARRFLGKMREAGLLVMDERGGS